MARIMVHGESDPMTDLVANWLSYKGHKIIGVEVQEEGRMFEMFQKEGPDLLILDSHVLKSPESKAMIRAILDENPQQKVMVTYGGDIPSFFGSSTQCSSKGFKSSIGINAPNIVAACKVYKSTDLLKMVEGLLEK